MYEFGTNVLRFGLSKLYMSHTFAGNPLVSSKNCWHHSFP